MRVVKEPLCPPHACAVIPGRGASKEPEGFVDTGTDLSAIDPHIYVSFEAVRQLGSVLDMHPDDDWQAMLKLVDSLDVEIADLKTKLEAAESALDAVEVLQSRFRKEEVVSGGA